MSVRPFFARASRTLAALVLFTAATGAHAVIVPAMSFDVSQLFNPFPGATKGVSATIFASTVPPLPPPTGTVTFEILDSTGSSVLSTPCPAVPATGIPDATAGCSVTVPTTLGSYVIRATYSGDVNYGTQQGSASFSVVPYNSYVYFNAAPANYATLRPGTTQTVQVLVGADGPSPTGTVSMYANNSRAEFTLPICSNVPLDASFLVTCTFTVPSTPGAYELGVNFVSSSSSYASGSNYQYFTVPYVVTSTADSGVGSLRDILTSINGSCNYSDLIDILFEIPGPGPHTIAPQTPLPPIGCDYVTLDGYSQPGAQANVSSFGATSANIKIILDGSACTGCAGLAMTGYWTKVFGLAIRSFAIAGIITDNDAYILGNYIGTDPGGSTAYGNGVGIRVNSGYATIGVSDSPPDVNLITGNLGAGVVVGTGAFGATINGNIIGGTSGGGSTVRNSQAIQVQGSGVDIVRNMIRYNDSGVIVDAGVTNVDFAGNAAYDNGGGPSFDLLDSSGNPGATPNDEATAPYDADSGANGLQNYPVITSATFDGESTTVTGYLKTDASSLANLIVELYSNTVARITDTGGENIFGSNFFSFDDTGLANFTISVFGRYDNISALARVNRCTLTDTALAPKGAKRGFGCRVASEYSPTVALAAAAVPQLSVTGGTGMLVAPVGGTSNPNVFTLTNVGTGTLTFGAVMAGVSVQGGMLKAAKATTSVSGITATAPFSYSTNCPASLAPNASCDVAVVVSPTALGTVTGTLTIQSNDPASPSTQGLTGYGAQTPSIGVNTAANPTAGSSTTVGVFIRNLDAAGGPTLSGVDAAVVVPVGYTINSGTASACGATPGSVSGNTVSATGAAIPTNTGCNIAVASLTVPAVPGDYTFTIPAGAVKVSAPYTWTNPVDITRVITVVAKPVTVAVSPTTLAFGSQATGTTSASQTVTVGNSGTAPAPFVMTPVTGPFVTTTNCGSAVPVTGCSIVVSFAPTSLGAATGSFTITAGGGTFTVSLSGTGVAPPAPIASVTPTSITFAARTVGTVSPASTVTVLNSGNANLAISAISSFGDFQHVSACPASLAPGATCDIDVKFAPVIVGARNGGLTVATNASPSLLSVALSGTGLANAIGTLSVSDGLVEFDATPVGGTSATAFVGIGNSGSANLVLSSALSGPFAFGVLPSGLSACPPVIAPGESCSIALVFKPTALGTASGALSLTSNGSNPRVDVVLVGAGSPALPTRALSVPARVDFGSIAVGVTSAARTVTLANNTAQVVAIRDIVVSGDFAAVDGCATVPARGSCALNVTFKPTVRGDRIGSLVIRTAAETEAYAIALAGTGEANPIPQLEVHPTSVGFGNSLLGPLYGHEPVELVNVGEVPVALGGMSAQADFVLDNRCGATLEVGARCTVFVSFYPRVAGSRTGTLSIGSNAAGTPHLVNLSGTGCTIPSVPRGRTPALVCAP